jgi:hypothetical protein
VEHCDDNADNIRELLLQDRDTLEELVFYKVSNFSGELELFHC